MNGVSKNAIALLAACAALAGCKSKGTYVHVQILPAANEPAGIVEIELDTSLAGKTDTLHFTNPDHSAIQLPTDVTLQVTSGGTGQLALTAIGYNAAHAEVDRAVTTATVASGAIVEASIQLPGGRADFVAQETTHDFNSIKSGTTTTPVNISFNNSGFKTSGNATATLGGAGAAAFVIDSNGCSAVAPAGSCSVAVHFAPTAVGAFAATLTLDPANGTPPAVVALTGNALTNPQNVTANITGLGSVDTNGLHCTNTNCTQPFEWGSQVSLTATPNTGYHFVRWSGACSGTNPAVCTFQVTADTTVTAQFAIDSEELTVSTSGNGVVTSLDTIIDCGGASISCTNAYDFGTQVTLTATADSGFHFVSWSEPACAGANPCVLTLQAAESITANFAPNAHTVTVTLSGTGGGVVQSNETPNAKLDCSLSGSGAPQVGTCTATYNFGDSFTINATPNSSSFGPDQGSSITGAGNTCASSPCTLTVIDSDITIDLVFTHNPVIIPVTFTGAGGGSVGNGSSSCSSTGSSCGLSEVYGSTPTVTATPDANSAFTNWSNGPCAGSTNPVCVFPSAIVTDTLVTANFVPAFAVTVSAGGNGSGTITSSDNVISCTISNGVITGGTCSTKVPSGSGLSLSASLNTGTASVAWTNCSASGTTCSLSNVSGTVGVTATLNLQTFTVTVKGPGGGAGQGSGTVTGAGGLSCTITAGVQSGTCTATVNYGSSYTLNQSFTGANNFVGWSGGCVGTGPSCPINNITSTPANVIATFTTTFTVTVVGPGAVAGAGSGNVTGGNLSCAITNGQAGASGCTTTVNYNGSIQLNETFTGANNFTGWTGGCVNSGPSCTISNITSTPPNVVANFVQTFTITVVGPGTSAGAGTGTIKDGGNINCTITNGTAGSTGCSTTVNYNGSIALNATFTGANNFVSYTNGCSSTTTSCSLSNITAPVQQIVANFTKTVVFSVSGGGTGTGKITGGGISCTWTGTANTGTCSVAVNYNGNISVVAAPNPVGASIFTNWSSGCSGGANSCGVSGLTFALSVTANFAPSLCGPSVTSGDLFGGNMQGCAGSVPWTNRASLCAANMHVCNSNEYVFANLGRAPLHNYWTDDNLNWSKDQGGPGDCGHSSCGPNNCFATLLNNVNYTNTCGGSPMLVCGAFTDPESNTCGWTGCGLGTVKPNQNFGGCPGASGAGTLCCPNATMHVYYVCGAANPPCTVAGFDTNSGTSFNSPFKTITHAIAVAKADNVQGQGDTIYVGPFNYSTSTGETFPILVPQSLALIGDEANRGAPAASSLTRINGNGTAVVGTASLNAAVIAQAGSTVAGFSILAPGGDAVDPAGPNVTIRNNTLVGNSVAMEIRSDAAVTNATVALNNISGGNTGLLVPAPGSNPAVTAKLENNVIASNSNQGMQLSQLGVDLGAGALNSAGNNTFSCNGLADITTNPIFSGTVSARSNQWDHVPPTTSPSTSGGVDIQNGSPASITYDTTFAVATPGACP